MAGFQVMLAPEHGTASPKQQEARPKRPGSALALLDSSSRVIDLVGMAQCGSNLVFGKAAAVIAVDRERDAPTAIDMARPAKGVFEGDEFLEEVLSFLQRRN